jgi:hypothetical protein
MNVETFARSASEDSGPPAGISRAAEAVWHAKAGNWRAGHDIAQHLPGSLGVWIHAHLHFIEGDLGNAAYWYARAEKPARGAEDIEEEWRELAEAVLGGNESLAMGCRGVCAGY